MIDILLDYMLRLAFTSIFIAASVAIWVLVWTLFESTKAGAIFIEWLKERKEDFLDDETKMSAESQGYLWELIRCKDCKYHHEAHYEEDGEKPIIKHKCKLLKGYQFSENHYCGFAKRKEE